MLILPLGLGQRCLNAKSEPSWSQVYGVPGSGYIGPACGCARCPVSPPLLKTKAHMGSSKGVPVCIHVSGCVHVWLFFLALMEKMKSKS